MEYIFKETGNIARQAKTEELLINPILIELL